MRTRFVAVVGVCFALAGAWYDDLGAATTADDFDYYRRLKIDLCNELPSLDDVNAIEAGTLTRADFDAKITECLDGDRFPHIVSLWVDDFILPSEGIQNASVRLIRRAPAGYYYEENAGKNVYVRDDESDPPDHDGDCRGVGLETVTDAYFATGDIDVCPGLRFDAGDPTRNGSYCPINVNRGSYTACSCGPRMLWCMLEDDPGGHGDVRARIREELQSEPAELVRRLVADDADFRTLFTARFSYRSDYLQHFLEANQGVEPVADVAAIDALAAMDEAARDAEGSHNRRTIAHFSADPALKRPRSLHGEHSGILTSYELLARQPTQANLAAQVYRFWTCEEITPRGAGYALTAAGGAPVVVDEDGAVGEFTTLVYTSPGISAATVDPLRIDTGPNEALSSHDTECYLCHKTVNSIAAFRNNWDDQGRLLPQLPSEFSGFRDFSEARGVFLDDPARNLDGLGRTLHDSETVQRCMVRRVFTSLTGRELDVVEDEEAIDDYYAAFSASSFNIKELYRAIVTSRPYLEGR